MDQYKAFEKWAFDHHENRDILTRGMNLRHALPMAWATWQAAQQQAQTKIAQLHAKLDKLLDHCPDMECPTCAEIICDHGCGMHFHHDGCPACAEHDAIHNMSQDK